MAVIGVFLVMIVIVKFFGYILHEVKDLDQEEDDNDKEIVESVLIWSVAVITQQG